MSNPLDDKVLMICKKIKFFKDIELEDLPKIVQSPSIKKYKAGELIIKEGEINREFYYIVKGEVKVVKNIGGTRKNLATMSSGRIFGEIATILQKPRNATIIATNDDTTIFNFNFDKELATKHPKAYSIFITNLAEELCTKINNLNLKIF